MDDTQVAFALAGMESKLTEAVSRLMDMTAQLKLQNGRIGKLEDSQLIQMGARQEREKWELREKETLAAAVIEDSEIRRQQREDDRSERAEWHTRTRWIIGLTVTAGIALAPIVTILINKL